MDRLVRHIETKGKVAGVKEKLLGVLNQQGFVIAGVSDVQEVFSSRLQIDLNSYVCYEVYMPWVYREILLASPDAALVPCTITIRQINKTVSISIINTTGLLLIGTDNQRIIQALNSLDKELDDVFNAISRQVAFIPDLDTSTK